MTESIGDILRQAREKRGLSVQDTHEATKILPNSITDLEENRFDSFANKVYARAFLRDYANFLNLDSAELLEAYEATLVDSSPSKEPAHSVAPKQRPSLRALGYALLLVIICAALAYGGYYSYEAYTSHRELARLRQKPFTQSPETHKVATMPKAPPVAPPKAPQKPEPAPQTPPAPVVEKLAVEVAALRPVWVRIKIDGSTVTEQIIAQGKTLSFEGKKSITVRAGMAGAVQIKVNGETQPPLGTLKSPGEKTYTLPAAPTPASTPVQPASASQ